MIAHMPVQCVIRHSDNRAISYHIDAYIVMSVLMFVMCAIRHSVERAVL